MSALNSLASSDRAQLERVALTGNISAVQAFVGALLWRWARQHWDAVLIRRRVLVFTLAVRVRDIAPFLAELLGPEPGPAP